MYHSARRHHRNNQVALVNYCLNHKRLVSLFRLREGSLVAMYLAYLRDPDGNKLCALHRPG